MSQFQVKEIVKLEPQGGLANLLMLGPKLITTSLAKTGELIQETMDILAKDMPTLSLTKKSSCCDIPESDCPPRCVCEVHWEACHGEVIASTIRVINHSGREQNFAFSAGPFEGPSGEVIPLQVSPVSASLKPNESVLVTVRFTVTDTFQPGQPYVAEVLIVGAYEQCVRLTCKVQEPRVSYCEVEYTRPPTRLRAQHWYRHFQCEEPCLPMSHATEEKHTR
jgi:hypothetical protein